MYLLLYQTLSNWNIRSMPYSPEHMAQSTVSYKHVKIAQSCLTLCDPMDCTVHGILHARILEWIAFPFSRGSSQPRSPALQVDSWPAEPQGSPRILERVAYPFSSRSSRPRNRTGVSCRFFTNWAIREALIYTEMFNNVCGDQFNEDGNTVTQLIFELVWVSGQWGIQIWRGYYSCLLPVLVYSSGITVLC